jgi:hypothetical protein
MHPNFYDSIKRSLIPLMHDDLAPILRCYTENVVSKSRTKKKYPIKESCHELVAGEVNSLNKSHSSKVDEIGAPSNLFNRFEEFSDEDLVVEIARRKAKKAREMKVNNESDTSGIPDPTGQVCTLHGGNGTIPCRELME